MDADFFPAFDLYNLPLMDNDLDRAVLNAGNGAQNFLVDIAGDRMMILWRRVVFHDVEQSMFCGARMYQFTLIRGTNKFSFVYHFFEYESASGRNTERERL